MRFSGDLANEQALTWVFRASDLTCGRIDLTPDRNGLQEACQPVQDERARHGHIEAGPGADHRDLDGDVDQFHRLIRNPVVLVP